MAVGTVGAYDPAADRWTTLDPDEDILVYDDYSWTGTELATTGWDYGLGSRDGVGQFVAAALDPTAGAWRASEWPLEPPGREGTASVWTGSELLAFVWSSTGCDGAIDCTLLVGWDPAEDRWRVCGRAAGRRLPRPRVGRRRAAGGDDGRSPDRGRPRGRRHPRDARAARARQHLRPGRRAGRGRRRDRDARPACALRPRRPDLDAAAPLPGAPADRRAVAWTSEGRTVWGGVADPSLDGSADSAEGGRT